MFSPINLSSPKSFQGRNLTGTARLVRDLAADIHANIQQWNNLHIQGITDLKDIIQEKRDENYSETLQDLCDKLENICDNLDGVVRNLDQIKQQLTALSTLHKTSDKLFTTWPTTKFGKEQPWIARFVKNTLCAAFATNFATEYQQKCEVAETIYKAYHMETKLKRKLFENVAHNYTESWKMVHLATWVYNPLLTEDVTTILLDSLLIETGHR